MAVFGAFFAFLRAAFDNVCYLGWNAFHRSVVYVGVLTGMYSEMWIPWYTFLAFIHRKGVAKLEFMNFGYEPIEEQMNLNDQQQTMLRERKGEQAQILLYEKLLSICPYYPSFSGMDLLEVGCGHGGGVKWMTEAHPEFGSIRGMDMKIVDTLDGKVFEGNAMDIPLEDESLDVVMNVESSHCYTFQLRYMSEVLRILRPGGYHILADLRPAGYRWDLVWEEAAQAGLELMHSYEITDNVLASLRKQKERVSMDNSRKWYMRLTRPLWVMFWGSPGSSIYNDLADRKWRYHVICWQKPVVRKSG